MDIPVSSLDRDVEDLRFVIWSTEHQLWWREREFGYTPNLELAGRYELLDAARILRQANCADEAKHQAKGPDYSGLMVPSEAALLAPECGFFVDMLIGAQQALESLDSNGSTGAAEPGFDPYAASPAPLLGAQLGDEAPRDQSPGDRGDAAGAGG